MITLGIETSCDDTSIALMNDRELLFHKSYDQEAMLHFWGGVVPEIAARNHLEKISPLLQFLFKTTKMAPQAVDLIGVTTHPGLLGPLLTGLNAAKTLSLIHKTPIIAVNHLYAHLEAIHLDQEVSYPYLGVLLSGGHSLFISVENASSFQILGSTIDDAAGEAFDKGGKLLGVPYPAGMLIDRLAKWGDPLKYTFPIGLRGSQNANLSYSGVKTALRVFLEKNSHILENSPDQLETFDKKYQDFYHVCASYQEAIIQAIKLKLKYALKLQKTQTPIVVGGGVAANSRLREVLNDTYKNVHFVTPKFCTDNGAMIANYARIHANEAIIYPENLKMDSKARFIEKKAFR